MRGKSERKGSGHGEGKSSEEDRVLRFYSDYMEANWKVLNRKLT